MIAEASAALGDGAASSAASEAIVGAQMMGSAATAASGLAPSLPIQLKKSGGGAPSLAAGPSAGGVRDLDKLATRSRHEVPWPSA